MPKSDAAAIVALRARLDRLTAQGHELELEGLPFPTMQIRDAFDRALGAGDAAAAERVVKGGESLLTKVAQDWTWVRELLRRADELRAIASTLGVDLQHLDTRVGNPRTRLQSEPLSSGSMQKAAASASLALAVLNDAIPKFCVQEAQNLGESIRRARNRGEEVADAGRAFGLLLQAVQDQNLALTAQRLVEARRSVSRIPRAPAVPVPGPHEEEEILREARNLARRLQRIKGRARDAQSAARLMSQVRAALSDDRRIDDRRYGTPEEEIEALYLEVDRISRERKLAAEPVSGVAPGDLDSLGERPETSRRPAEPAGDTSDAHAPEEGEEPEEKLAFLPYNPYVPPEIPPAGETPEAAAARARSRASRPRP
ncbi:MAG TPA: hypothetical protein VEL82_08415 [Thermoplasmata archaeon]|nr:hypothetical protein [Thermoplasmata archaeon]